MIQSALGGENITRTIEGRERYPVNVRYDAGLPRDASPISSACSSRRRWARRFRSGSSRQITLTTGPAMIRDENAQLAGYVYIDTATRDIGGYVDRARQAIAVERARCRPATRCSGPGSTSSRCAPASGCRS